MRKVITFLLLAATAGSPLAAQVWDGRGDRDARDGGRGDQRGDQRGGDRADRIDDRRPGDPRVIRPDQRGDWRDGDRAGVVARDWRNGGDRDQRRYDRDEGRGRNWADRRDDGRGRDWNDRRDDGRGRQWSDNDRGGWNDRWREDRRYDWQRYRTSNRAIYRAPRYYGPRGYDYSRWSRGYRVQPYFYGQNYWISDPWRYRLPAAYGSYRWVRYYDDVALIDIRSGLIEDIIYSFFYR